MDTNGHQTPEHVRAGSNPSFFEGTTLAKATAALLAETPAGARR
jgi:hypothetical protein